MKGGGRERKEWGGEGRGGGEGEVMPRGRKGWGEGAAASSKRRFIRNRCVSKYTHSRNL